MYGRLSLRTACLSCKEIKPPADCRGVFEVFGRVLQMKGKREDYITWDEYFMGVAKLSGMRSKDPNS